MTRNIQHSIDSPAANHHLFIERRINTSDRRTGRDRRSQKERRFDSRMATAQPRKTFRAWLRALFNARLGVDRRKTENRRVIPDRRQRTLRSILTQEEINDLLAP